MTLESKTENAIIAHLSGDDELGGLGFARNFSDGVKDGQVVITAERGEEVAAPSGVYEVEVDISLRIRHRRFGGTADRADELAGRIEQLLSQPQLHELLARNQTDYHCYHAALGSAERGPQDSKLFEHIFSLHLEAMPQDFKTVEKLYARTQHTTA